MRRLLLLAAIVAAFAFGQQPGPALAVDANADVHPISPEIYGINLYFTDEAAGDYWALHPDQAHAASSAALRIGVRRWGGNSTSRYDWRNDVWNSAADWYFEVTPDNNAHPELLPDGSRFDDMVEFTRVSGSKMMGTIPVLEWLPASRQHVCSFSTAKYGAQCHTDGICGNGVRYESVCATGGDPANPVYIQNDPRDAAVQKDETYQQEWIHYLISRYGPANQGGVAIWSLDNEPVWWNGTHRDIHPEPQTYDDTWDRTLPYAQAIKDADPTALVTGPVSAGWGSFFFSNRDFVSGWSTAPGNFWSNPTDRNAHGGIDFSSWYLQQFATYEAQHGRRLLDYFDLHTYNILRTPQTEAERLRSTRMLWDPNFVATDSFWGFDDQGQPARPQLIPRMRQWVSMNYPGTKTAITEYDFGGLDTITGALTLADALGIFGREGLDLATLWPLTSFNTTDPGAYSFLMYRNYDAIGGSFGENSVRATTADPDQLSVFAALRSDSALTILVLNKTTGYLSSSIAISNFTPAQNAQVWRYSQANLHQIVHLSDAALSGSTINATFPAYSMTLFVVPKAAGALPVPKPVIMAVTNAASYGTQIAPGQMVILWGTNLGPHVQDNEILAPDNMVNTSMDGVRVLFDGVPSPMVYVWSVEAGQPATQISAVVPYPGATNQQTHVQVEYQGVRSDAFAAAISPTAPGLFTNTMLGTGQAAMQNQDQVTQNSPQAPAHPGEVVILWGTGEGVTDPPGVDGRLAIDILPKPVADCSVTIGGRPATVEYCGAAPFNMPGLFQVNARIDPAVTPSDQTPVTVTIGGASSQPGVTMVVR